MTDTNNAITMDFDTTSPSTATKRALESSGPEQPNARLKTPITSPTAGQPQPLSLTNTAHEPGADTNAVASQRGSDPAANANADGNNRADVLH